MQPRSHNAAIRAGNPIKLQAKPLLYKAYFAPTAVLLGLRSSAISNLL
jgi:hypothetical protein